MKGGSSCRIPQLTHISDFNFGIGVTEATNNPVLAGARSPGHGFWTSTGQNTYNAVIEAFIYNDVLNTPIKAGTQKILQNITMSDNNNWSETGAEVKFFDTSGTNYLSACANATATRLTGSDSEP